jgi:hypothetical protein
MAETGPSPPPAPAAPAVAGVLAGDTLVLLLGAAARLINHCYRAADTSCAADIILTKGSQSSSSSSMASEDQQTEGVTTTQGQECSSDLLADALNAVRCLADHFITNDTLWRTVKGKSPLLLIQGLSEATTVSGRWHASDRKVWVALSCLTCTGRAVKSAETTKGLEHAVYHHGRQLQ